jgi:hypothetical protein
MPAPTIEVNGSAKMLVWLNGGGDTLLAFNLGIGLSPGSGSVWLRPEVGYLTNPGESRHAFHAGIGLSFTTGAR